MGGGNVTRPNFGGNVPNPDAPMTEFYLLLQQGVEKTGRFALPGCWGSFRPDFSGQIFEEDMPRLCRFSAKEGQGKEILSPSVMTVDHHELCLAADGTPVALFLSGALRREHYAVRLLPPFPGVELPAAPADVPLIELSVSEEMLDLADSRPDLLSEQMALALNGKNWESHPAVDAWMTKVLAAAQREYRRLDGQYGQLRR